MNFDADVNFWISNTLKELGKSMQDEVAIEGLVPISAIVSQIFVVSMRRKDQRKQRLCETAEI